ncbi:hypothetical protein THOM_1472 [Trachipleistophora hominis]|uniref:LRR containing protein n=1 Tax=Trachipleistophora hominis TaxID=72359 RepID=L7JVR1_TRAHO|nr:hypothetical protein THOM_1472 [Trachipleistophora hominis]
MNKFLLFILAEILYCAYSLDQAETQNPSHSEISSISHYDQEQTVKIVEMVQRILNENGCTGLLQFLRAAAYQSFRATFMTVASNSIMFVINNEDFNLQFVHSDNELRGAKNTHLLKININIDLSALGSCVKLFNIFNFGYMKAVVKTHTGIQEYLPQLLTLFNHIIKLDLEVDHITDETMQKLSTLKLRQFYIGVAELKLDDLRNLLNFEFLVMKIIADNLQIDSLSRITLIVMNKVCRKCVIKIQGHSYDRPQGAFMVTELSGQQNVVKIILDNLSSPSINCSFGLELNSMLFHPICVVRSNVEQLTLKFENELYVNELLWCCVGLKILNLQFKRIVNGFSFMRSKNLYLTLEEFKISVKEDVNCNAQMLNEALHHFECLINVDIRIKFSDSSSENVFNESLITSLESLTIDSNALDENFFKHAMEFYELENVDINRPTNTTTVHTMTMLSDLTALPALTNLSLDRVSNTHEWQILENCRGLLSLEIKTSIDFPLITSTDSQFYRTLENLSISLDICIIQHVRLTFVKLTYLSLEVTSENSNLSVNDSAVHCFMQANFDGGINETLATLILRQNTSFDLTLLSTFTFPALTCMCLEVFDPYERGYDEQFGRNFYSHISGRFVLLKRLHFIFKCSQRHLVFEFN